MYWIESINRRHAGGYELNGRDLTGRTAAFYPAEFPHLDSVATKVTTTVSSSNHEVTPVDDFLKHMGWSELNGANQRLHRFYTDSLEIWVPSQAIFKMMFSTHAMLYETAFSGRSVNELVSPSLTDDPLDLMPGWRRKSATRLYERDENGEQNTLLCRLFWLLHSVSARRSFAHVYRNASTGVLDVPLPKGDFEVHVCGKRVGDLMLATRIRTSSVTCTDLRLLDGAPIEPMELEFFRRDLSRGRKRGMTETPLDDLSKWSMGNEWFRQMLNWMFDNGIIGGRENYTEEHAMVLKRHLELLRARFLGRYEWKSLPCSKQELACVQARLYKLRQAGHWDRVSEKLLAT